MEFEAFKELIHQWIHMEYVEPEDVPEIELYMDQVTTFMDSHLGQSLKGPEDKILTKTMINNYAKNKLIPPPNKKKYTKNHIFLLIYIYYFKNILSISDIQNLLQPMTDSFFHAEKDDPINFTSIYRDILNGVLDHHQRVKGNIDETVGLAKQIFAHGEGADNQYLNDFALICLLSYDIFVKKRLVEQMIGNLYTPDEKKK